MSELQYTMAKRSTDSEGQESKRNRQGAEDEVDVVTYSKMFFSGEQVDDVFIICKEWWGGNAVLDIYFRTRAIAEEFVELIRKRDKVEGDKYTVHMLRRAEGSDEQLCKSLIIQRPIDRT